MNGPTEPLWTSAQVSTFLGLGKNAPAELVNRGALPAMRIGRALRFDPAEVRAFATRCAVRPGAAVLPLRRAAALAKSASLRKGEGG